MLSEEEARRRLARLIRRTLARARARRAADMADARGRHEGEVTMDERPDRLRGELLRVARERAVAEAAGDHQAAADLDRRLADLQARLAARATARARAVGGEDFAREIAFLGDLLAADEHDGGDPDDDRPVPPDGHGGATPDEEG